MAIIDYNFMSQSLMHPTTVKLVMPCNNKPEYVMIFLHGVLSDANNCVSNMDVQGMADRYKVAFIIPSCGNSFYIDHGVAFGNDGKFVGTAIQSSNGQGTHHYCRILNGRIWCNKKRCKIL